MRGLGTLAVLALVAAAFVVLLGLGLWQLDRNQQKQDLTSESEAAIAAPPLAADAAAAGDEGNAWRRLALEGEWDYERAQIVANRTRFGLRGEEVHVPLLPPGGGPAILVNRGWYPRELREQVLAELATNEPAEGLILAPFGTAGRRTADGTWTRFDLDAIAAELPYALAPIRVLAGELVESQPRRMPEELPVTGFESFRNTTPHIEYALSWFGLAAALVATAGVRIWQRRHGEEAGTRAPVLERSAHDGHEAA